VLAAQLTALSTLRSGMSGSEADAIARAIIEEAGFGEFFGHSLGHGVGLAVHEKPVLGARSIDVLADGMVFTIEPGIYKTGVSGVRIENMVVLTDGKPELLTKTPVSLTLL
jgi:Xaa-Pro aminopeptidase